MNQVTITPDVLEVGFHSVHLPQPSNGDYRNLSSNADGLLIVMTRDELRELKKILNGMDFE